jgi:hypothetical protein
MLVFYDKGLYPDLPSTMPLFCKLKGHWRVNSREVAVKKKYLLYEVDPYISNKGFLAVIKQIHSYTYMCRSH